jgi:hypothetical protein
MFSKNFLKLHFQFPSYHILKGSLYLTSIYLNYVDLDLTLSTTKRSSIISQPLTPAKSSTFIHQLLAPDQKWLTHLNQFMPKIVCSQHSFFEV